MTDYKKYLAEERIPTDVPEDVVDENGRFYHGTYKQEFENMNFLHADRPRGNPNFFNKSIYTTWEAAEVVFDDIAILTAVSPMFGGMVGVCLTLLFDRKAGKKYAWMGLSPKPSFAPNLLRGNITEGKNPLDHVKFVNEYDRDKAYLSGKGKSVAGSISYDLEFTRASLPSNVLIPFHKNCTLYSQKDIWSVTGSLKWNDKVYTANENTFATIDDHRGFYPFHMHYDWVATMGRLEYDGALRPFGFNLTRNQSVDQDRYNENLIFLDGRTSRLPPVVFEHVTENKWHITDEYGMVDVYYHIQDRHLTKIPLVMDYSIFFGTLEGHLLDEDGNKYVLDGMCGLGEDKSTNM